MGKGSGKGGKMEPQGARALPSQINELVKRHWGWGAAKSFQCSAIEAALSGRDTFIIQATGSGKSLCYQLPPLISGKITLVVSPLISLMQDQVQAALSRNIRAEYLGQTQSDAAVFQRAEAKQLDLIFVTPEKLQSESAVRYLKQLRGKELLGLLAIDEAHCVSEWGADFRPDYRKLAALRDALPGLPVMALTATATERVRADIESNLRLRAPLVLLSTFNRPNLFYSAHLRTSVQADLKPLVEECRASRASALVYVLKQKDCEAIAAVLREQGIAAEPYHAGMSAGDRERVHRGFMQDRVQVVCATVAFGMGIDKPDVRHVVHYGLPKSLETYYQQSGRAGRDGEPAQCRLYFSSADYAMVNFYVQGVEAAQQATVREMFRSMQGYAETGGCRRRYVLQYFGEGAAEGCGACDNCKEGGRRPDHDFTDDARLLLLAIQETGERFGLTVPVQVLRGSKSKEVLGKESMFRVPVERMKSHGSGRHQPDEYWKALLRALVREGYATAQAVTTQHGGFETFGLSPKGRDVALGKAGGQRVAFAVPQEIAALQARAARLSGAGEAAANAASGFVASVVPNSASDPAAAELARKLEGLYAALMDWRRAVAAEQNLPAYCVCDNKTLRNVSLVRPASLAALRKVEGIGEGRLERYGAALANRIDVDSGEGLPEASQVAQPRGSAGEAGRPAKITATKAEAHSLFQAGRSVPEIAALKGVAVSTIENYLSDCAAAGMAVDAERFGCTAEVQGLVRAAVGRLGGEARLKALKEALPEHVSYGHLKMALALLNPPPAEAAAPPASSSSSSSSAAAPKAKASIVRGGGAAAQEAGWRAVVAARGKRPSEGSSSEEAPEDSPGASKRARGPPTREAIAERVAAAAAGGGLTRGELAAALGCGEGELGAPLDALQADFVLYLSASGRLLPL
eukprot:tig00020961_g16648.t1